MTYVKKYAVLLMGCVTLLCAVFLGGCENAPPPQKTAGKPLVGILVYRKDDVYIGLVTRAMLDTFSGKADVELLYAESDQLLQNEQIDTLLKKGVSAIALNIVETRAAATSVDNIKKAGIPVVMFNREPDLGSIGTYEKLRFVGTNPFDAGIMQGDIITDLWGKHPEYDKNKDGKVQYLMLQATLDNPESLARTEYSVKQARERGLRLEQLGATLHCDWDESLAHSSLKDIFPTYEKDLELIISNNDAMALGALRVLNEFGYNLPGSAPEKYIPVVGVDAIPPAIDAIKKGMMSGTVIQDAESMGKAVAGMICNAVTGKDFLDGLPFSWDASGMAVRIPYARFVIPD